MENNEIRLKVAKIKGWTVIQDLSLDMQPWLEGIPNWPVNIADAMGLIVEMQSEPYLQAIQITRVPAIGKRWVMWVGANITETGDTLPMVICLAYIQWKESQK